MVVLSPLPRVERIECDGEQGELMDRAPAASAVHAQLWGAIQDRMCRCCSWSFSARGMHRMSEKMQAASSEQACAVQLSLNTALKLRCST